MVGVGSSRVVSTRRILTLWSRITVGRRWSFNRCVGRSRHVTDTALGRASVVTRLLLLLLALVSHFAAADIFGVVPDVAVRADDRIAGLGLIAVGPTWSRGKGSIELFSRSRRVIRYVRVLLK